MNIRILSCIALILALPACDAMLGPLNTDYDELNNARSAIDRARSAGAEVCAPGAMSDAQASLFHAAHELTEGSIHLEETSGLIAKAEKWANDAYNQTKQKCGAKLASVNFDFDSNGLTAVAAAILDRAASTLKAEPGMRITVAGHTDSDGDAGYNVGLSQRRAASVKQSLVSRGVAGRMKTKAYGETQPIAGNDTDTGKAANRRADIWIVKTR